MYGIITFVRIDTTPGGRSAFAPPPGFEGDYRAFIRTRYRTDPGVQQHVLIVGKRLLDGEPTEFVGPYAKEAELIARAAAGPRQPTGKE